MIRLLSLLLPLLAVAQTPQLALSGPTLPVMPGATASLILSIAGVGTTGIADVQISVASIGGTVTCTASAAVAAQGKQVACNVNNGDLILLVFGGQNALADGALATISIAVPRTAAGAIPEAITGALGATAQGFFQAVTVAPPITLTLMSLCDANGDGVVNAVDVAAYVNKIIFGTGPAQKLDGSTGDVNVIDLRRVVNASVGQACKVN